MSGAPVHAEVEEHEVRPRVDRVIEDVDALVARDALCADVAVGLDPHREDLVVGRHVAVDLDAEIGQQAVHHGGVAELVLHDLGDDVLFLHAGRLHDPRHVAVPAGQLGVGLHGHEMHEVVPILRSHLAGRLQPVAAGDLTHHRVLEAAHGSSSVTFVPPRERPCPPSAGSSAARAA